MSGRDGHAVPSRRGTGGFTLLELLAVVALTTLVLTVAINFFIDLSRASNEAADRTRAQRRATAVLDRVAHELEGAYLVKKPEETDPLEHPWLFLAESVRGGPGADRIKFMTRTAPQPSLDGHASDVTVVAYGTRETLADGLELLRWSSDRMPPGLDRTVPLEDEATLVLASGLASFGVRLLSDTGEWTPTWDSSTLVESSELPVAAEIEVSMLPPPGAIEAGAAEPVGPFVRRVLIPVRPVDLEVLLDPEGAAAAGEEEGEEDGEDGPGDSGTQQAEAESPDEQCMTVAQCLALNPGVVQQFPQVQGLLTAIGGQCFRDYAASIPAGVNLVGCR